MRNFDNLEDLRINTPLSRYWQPTTKEQEVTVKVLADLDHLDVWMAYHPHDMVLHRNDEYAEFLVDFTYILAAHADYDGETMSVVVDDNLVYEAVRDSVRSIDPYAEFEIVY